MNTYGYRNASIVMDYLHHQLRVSELALKHKISAQRIYQMIEKAVEITGMELPRHDQTAELSEFALRLRRYAFPHVGYFKNTPEAFYYELLNETRIYRGM